MSTLTTRFPSILSDLLVLMTTSPVLGIAIRALGAMCASRLGTVGARGGVLHLQVVATRFYQRAIGTLRVCLSDKNHVQGDDVLWATFLLGLFEVFTDSVMGILIPVLPDDFRHANRVLFCPSFSARDPETAT
jgi:hypothetical protein